MIEEDDFLVDECLNNSLEQNFLSTSPLNSLSEWAHYSLDKSAWTPPQALLLTSCVLVRVRWNLSPGEGQCGSGTVHVVQAAGPGSISNNKEGNTALILPDCPLSSESLRVEQLWVVPVLRVIHYPGHIGINWSTSWQGVAGTGLLLCRVVSCRLCGMAVEDLVDDASV